MRAAAIALALFFMAPAARAGGVDEDEARAAMRRGREALERGDAKGALEEYERAKRLAPGANAPWYFAADALERLERWPAAVESLEGYLRLDPTVSDAVQVKERIARLRAAHFPVHLRVVVDPPGAMVSVDQGAPALPSEVELRPGRHHVEATAPEFEPAAQDVELPGDTTQTLTLVLRHIAPEPPRPVVLRAPAPAHAARRGVPWRTVGWVTAGVGAAGFATMLVLDTTTLRARIDDLRGAANRSGYQDRTEQLFKQVDDLQTGLLVGYVVSAGVGIVGLALGLFGPRQAHDERTMLVPWVGPSGGGLMLTGRR